MLKTSYVNFSFGDLLKINYAKHMKKFWTKILSSAIKLVHAKIGINYMFRKRHILGKLNNF